MILNSQFHFNPWQDHNSQASFLKMSIVNADNLDFAQTVADGLSVGGGMASMAGTLSAGTSVVNMLTILMGVGAIVGSCDLKRQIDEIRSKPTNSK